MATLKVLIFLIFINRCFASHLSEDGRLNFLELATKYGHNAIQYIVITEDGYILTIFRIPGKRKIPILLMHGLADTSDTWVIRGNSSLAITLANDGYDVWAGNVRGNKYGRNNIYLNPDTDKEFWNFSFHEYGFYDLAAIIDTILNITKVSQINTIGHSQGNAIFYVLCSLKPEYNKKINFLIALAPIAFLQNVKPPLKDIIEISPIINKLSQILNIRELFKKDSVLIDVWQFLCPEPIIGYISCVKSIIFPIAGYDSEELESNFVPTLVGHFPNGVSEKNLYHFAQVSLRRKFAQYDYGENNIAIYNSEEPPQYNLSAVTIKIYLFSGANDKLATLEDVAILREKLPNDEYLLLPRRKMNHADFIWGRHMNEYLFPYIFKVLRNF